ncbi:MAG TPA: AbiV family abortive infection protein [Terriglobia bacterium]|nr:AbiV family abortive infection protein [Terriglobia bacterium]
MAVDEVAGKRKMELAIEATAKGKILFSSEFTKDEFNRGCDHVCSLLQDSYKLYSSGSFATSLFLSITAIEEIAKLEIALYREAERTAPAARRHEDLLFNHKAKHSIALQEVIAIGSRLPKVIGEDRVRELLDMAESGELLKLRESALYADNVGGKFICPEDRIHRESARAILLLALEVWDDRLVGLTDHTYEIDSELSSLFDEVAPSLLP